MATATEAKERVVFIEYRGGKPFEVITRKPIVHYDGTAGTCTEYYDIEWCKRDGEYYYHNSGSGGGETVTIYGNVGGTTRFWATDDIKVKRGSKAKITRLKRAKYREKLEKALNGEGWDYAPFNEGRCEYCPTCDDYLPCEDTDEICEHVWYCGESDEWSKPGERCKWSCKECREYERESTKPPMLTVAEGYGRAALDLPEVVREIMAERGLTAKGIGALMGGCREWEEGVEAAARGEVHEGFEEYRFGQLMVALHISDEDQKRLRKAFDRAKEPAGI